MFYSGIIVLIGHPHPEDLGFGFLKDLQRFLVIYGGPGIKESRDGHRKRAQPGLGCL